MQSNTVSDIGTQRIILPHNHDFTLTEPTIQPWDVTVDKLKSLHGEIISYYPPIIMITPNYGGIDVIDDGFSIKPEIDLYQLFVNTFKRMPFSGEHVEFINHVDVAIIASCTKVPAVKVGDGWPITTHLTLTNYGIIYGRGGDAGISSKVAETSSKITSGDGVIRYNLRQILPNESLVSTAGRPGGPAVRTGEIRHFTILNHGKIAGGGGGAGGSSFWCYTLDMLLPARGVISEHSGCLSGSGGAPYGRPFTGSLGWQANLLDTSTGRLREFWEKYKNDSEAKVHRKQAMIVRTPANEYQFWSDADNPLTVQPISVNEIPEDSIIRTASTSNAYFYRLDSLRFDWFGTYTDPITGNVYDSGTDKLLTRIATRSLINTPAKAGNDVGPISKISNDPSISTPYGVCKRNDWSGNGPSEAEREMISNVQVGGMGGIPGFPGKNGTGELEGFADRKGYYFDIYAENANDFTIPTWRGVVKGAALGGQKIKMERSAGGDGGSVRAAKTDNMTIFTSMSGSTIGSGIINNGGDGTYGH